MLYNFNEIEKKWQEYWAEHQSFKAVNNSAKPKYYVLDMFPYPSGAGLHVGHPLGYIASDIIARYKRHCGFNVLHPQGYDSFGLPAEQYAIQTGKHPAKTTEENINRYRKQLDQMGFSFDWSREIRTSNPDFYKWTQWIFLLIFGSFYCKTANKALSVSDLITEFEKNGNLKVNAECDAKTPKFNASEWSAFSSEEKQSVLLHYRLTYLAEREVNWCEEMGTILANDEVVNGVSERGGFPVVKRKMKQWNMRIGAYAERLLQGLETIDWPDPLKETQRNWIGKSVGASVLFEIEGYDDQIEVFTTRPDTIFGVTFMTLAPELELVQKITAPDQREAVDEYIIATKQRSERDRMTDVKTISGVFTGTYALHPFTKKLVPIWVSDYVLADYGTGAVMAVPCGDQRDYDFAKHFGIPIVNIFKNTDVSKGSFTDKTNAIITNSDFLNGLNHEEAVAKTIERLKALNCGKGTVSYRLRDAVFSRQRYWGEPIPIYFKKGVPHPLSFDDLPLRLPEVENYLPTPEGAPPLGNALEWAWDTKKRKVVLNKSIDHETVFPLELNTMPGWAGSSWYFYRYMDARNSEVFTSSEAMNYWKDVDLYLGGSEHAAGHLLYSRFWQKFLYDRGYLPVEEYAKKLINQGMILGTSALIYRKSGTNVYVSFNNISDDDSFEPIRVDVNLISSSDELDIERLRQWQPQFAGAQFELDKEGKFIVGREVEKMSKSKYNIVNPDNICENYGADTLRMYEMFLGPLEQAKPWNTAGITGVQGFMKKLWRLFFDKEEWIVTESKPSSEALKILHETINKVTHDIEHFSFNTCVSSFMICVNKLSSLKCRERAVLEPLVVLLSPFAPHISEELWELLGYEGGITNVPYPKHNDAFLIEESKTYPISFNGKMRFTLELPSTLKVQEIEAIVIADKRTKEYLNGIAPKKVIIVPNKIVNIVF